MKKILIINSSLIVPRVVKNDTYTVDNFLKALQEFLGDEYFVFVAEIDEYIYIKTL